MKNSDAKIVIEKELLKLKALKYNDLVNLLNKPLYYNCQGENSVNYTFEFFVDWENTENEKRLRVFAAIDDEGLVSSVIPYRITYTVDQ